jgi:hypothetical protein
LSQRWKQRLLTHLQRQQPRRLLSDLGAPQSMRPRFPRQFRLQDASERPQPFAKRGKTWLLAPNR